MTFKGKAAKLESQLTTVLGAECRISLNGLIVESNDESIIDILNLKIAHVMTFYKAINGKILFKWK